MKFRDLAFASRLILGQVFIIMFLWYSRKNPPVFPVESNFLIGWVLKLAAVGVILYGIWYAIRLNRYWRENPDGADAQTIGPLPMPASAIGAVFMKGFKTEKVVVDLEARSILFQNCFVPREWLGCKQAWFSCPLADLRAVYPMGYRSNRGLVICTIAGKADVPPTAQGFAELRDFLTELVPQNDPGFVADDPGLLSWYPVVCLVGMLVGAWLVPIQSRWLTLLGAMLLGAFLSAFAAYGLVVLVVRSRRK